ncbi:MAG: hypothetical protein ACM3SU_12745 [Acidobacteriota bacterium]
MLRNASRLALVALACALAVGCGKYKRLAATAIKTAEKAVASAGDDVPRYAPDQWKEITGSLAAAKDSYARGEYKAAIDGLRDIGTKVQAAQVAASTKETELANAWKESSDAVARMIEAIKSRVDILSASRKLPKGIDKARLEEARSGLAGATQAWNEASEAFKAGKLADAVARAGSVKDKATRIMESLGMTPPAAGGATPAAK